MQISNPSNPGTAVSSPDHFYTTNPKDYTAQGYRFEGILGYLYPTKFANTIALHHWYNSTVRDNFYTHEDPDKSPPADEGEAPSTNGYEYQGIIGYIYRNPEGGTVPLLRWWSATPSDHFYCTDPRGEIAPEVGYVFEGVTGYLFPNPTQGTIPLFRWYYP